VRENDRAVQGDEQSANQLTILTKCKFLTGNVLVMRPIFATFAVALLGGCVAPSNVSSDLTVNTECTVTFRSDIQRRVESSYSGTASESGKLVELSANWIILKSNVGSKTIIPREAILHVVCNEDAPPR
jgi:hypothetical protein